MPSPAPEAPLDSSVPLDPEVHRALGLTDDEADEIARILGGAGQRDQNHDPCGFRRGGGKGGSRMARL